MKPSSLQEKFQITAKPKREELDAWVSPSSARPAQPDVGNWAPRTPTDMDPRKFNLMPHDMDIPSELAEVNAMPFSMGGQSDVSKDYNEGSVKSGFTRRDMAGTDDQYTGEHMDLFYGDAGGFAERNNYLDRL